MPRALVRLTICPPKEPGESVLGYCWKGSIATGRKRIKGLADYLVERRTLEAAYPGNRRTWLPFRGGAYSGANLFWLGSPAALEALAVWRRIEQQRKKARAVLGAFGVGLALLIAARLVTLDKAIARAGRKIGVKARAVVLLTAG